MPRSRKMIRLPDRVVLNGWIYSADALNRRDKAFAIRGGKIAFVGTDIDVQVADRTRHRVIDLKRQMVMPASK